MTLSQLFQGPNEGYLLELYDHYLANPASVPDAYRQLFEQWRPEQQQGVTTYQNGHEVVAPKGRESADASILIGITKLVNAIRTHGHSAAKLDPLNIQQRQPDPALALQTYQLSEPLLRQQPATFIDGPIGMGSPNAWEAIQTLNTIYTNTSAYEFNHIMDPEEREWLYNAVESRRYHPDTTPIDDVALLERLTAVEGFEQFLHRAFQAKKRFSIEGLDVMVPMLDEMVKLAEQGQIRHIIMGMAHRGRLNVLAHVLEKAYSNILGEFREVVREADGNWTGDVKYHSGAKRQMSEQTLVELAANPSHLELINPVIIGMARAAGSETDRGGEVTFDKFAVMPILIHGDAAFPGQGIVAETLNFSHVPGWRVGGTIHIIANNQVGFTTDAKETRSTPYASDLAKGFRIPIIHVNADDVEACIEVSRLAIAYQDRFEKDILIDLIGYRRYGHNEGDEPRFTQPVMYQKIDQHKTVRALWAETLLQRGRISSTTADEMMKELHRHLQEILDTVQKSATPTPPFTPDPEVVSQVATGVSADLLRQLNDSLSTYPTTFTPFDKLERLLNSRRQALIDLETPNIDWGQAEVLAFATILADGTPIRLTGEDVERGTFGHRHTAYRDVTTGKKYFPHQHLSQAKASFECRNSPLSENAALGFEYGYSLQDPTRLVLWEAQFGDFVNGAQPVIDQFISSGRAKWGDRVGLVMLLPHGYEGQGPDHSSARLERFLSLAADRNMRVVYPTTSANYFHLLRRQAALIKSEPLPLIVMSPKSLLRHALSRASLRELVEGTWQPVIDDQTINAKSRKNIQRVVFCSGKIGVEALEYRGKLPDIPVATAIIRVEQLYRFPLSQVQAILESYKGVKEVVWLQEEPHNGGAWSYVQPLLIKAAEKLKVGEIRYIGRPNRASTAEGFYAWHQKKQEELLQLTFLSPIGK